jgi:hypothetical protein
MSLAQRVAPQIANSAGFDLSNGSIVISFSLGEPAVATLSNSEFIITQGFLQPEIIPCNDAELTYYPNPTQDELTVDINGCETKIESMQLIDIWGRLITTIMPTSDNKVFLGDVSPGVYFLRVFLTNTESQTLKIAKVSN